MANLIERVTVENPYQYEDTCSHIVTASNSTLVISDWMPYLSDYTVQFWYKSTSNATLLFSCDNETKSLSSTPQWQQFVFTFYADTLDDIEITFPIGEYWIYNTKAEIGNFPTDWSPHPDDTSDTILGFEERLIQAERTISSTSFEVNKELEKISGFITREEMQSDIDGIKQSIDDVSQGYGKWYVALFDKDEFQDVVTEEPDPDPTPWAEQEEVVQIDDKEKYDYTIFSGENELIEPLSEISVSDSYDGMMSIGSTANRIVHYLTYANFTESTTLNLSFTHGKCTLYVNAIPVFSSAESTTDTVSLSFDPGWSIIEIISNESAAAFGDDTGEYPVISDAETCETLNCFLAVPTKRTVKQRSLYSYFDQGIDHIRTAVGEEIRTFEDGFLINGETYASFFEQTKDKFDFLVVANGESSHFDISATAMTSITNQFIIKDTTGTETIITGGSILANSITADMLSADAVTSTNFLAETWNAGMGEPHYVDSGTKIDLLNGNIYTPGLYVNGTSGDAWFKGIVYATDGEFTGTVYANSGEFRGTVYAEDGEFSGTVHASDGDFSGTIISDDGHIGPWNIEEHSIWKGTSETLGLSGTGNAYLGDLGFSLSDKFVYDSTEGTLSIKVDSLLIGTSESDVEGIIDDKLTAYNIQYYSNGVPTNDNFPASDWSMLEKDGHVGDICYDKLSGKKYRYAKYYSGLLIKFSDDCITQDVKKDYVRIYYQLGQNKYKLPDLGGGYNNTTNTIAGAEVFVPSNSFYLLWKTDSSTDSLYGYSIDYVDPSIGESTGSLVTSNSELNRFEDFVILNENFYPESNHERYGNSKNDLYYCTSDEYQDIQPSFEWVLLEDADIQTAINNANAANEKAQQAINSFDNLVISGRNILKMEDISGWSSSIESLSDYKISLLTNAAKSGFCLDRDLFILGDIHCLSFKFCKNTSEELEENELKNIAFFSEYNGTSNTYYIDSVYIDNVKYNPTGSGKNITIQLEDNGDIHYAVVLFKKVSNTNNKFYIYFNYSDSNENFIITKVNLWDVQLEVGTKPTGWSPMPEEIQERLNQIEKEANAYFWTKPNSPDAGLYVTEYQINEDNYSQRVGGNILLNSNGLNIFNGTMKLVTYGQNTYFYSYSDTNNDGVLEQKVAATLGSAGLSIEKGSIQLGTYLNDDYIYLGPNGFSLNDKLTYDARNGALNLKVNSLSIGDTDMDSFIYKDSTYYSETKPTTTSNSYPFNTWKTAEELRSHVGDLCYDTSSGKLYRFKRADRKIKITFSTDSYTRSSADDYVQFYFVLNGTTCKTSTNFGGNSISGKEVVLPCETFYLFWHTDARYNNYYGFSIDSIEATSDEVDNYSTATDLPNVPKTTLVPGKLPESHHNPYLDNQDVLWYVQPIIEDVSYEWEEVTVNSYGDFETVNLLSVNDIIVNENFLKEVDKDEYKLTVTYNYSNTTRYVAIPKGIFDAEESYLISFKFKKVNLSQDMGFVQFDCFNNYILLDCKFDDDDLGKDVDIIEFAGFGDGTYNPNVEHRVQLIIQKKASASKDFTINFNQGYANIVTVEFSEIMVQRGEVFTGWSPCFIDLFDNIKDADQSKNYLWYDATNGLVIYNGRKQNGEKFTIDATGDVSNIETGNIRLTTGGMDIYDGQTIVATYGATTYFYKYGSNNVAASLDATGLHITDGSISIGSKTGYADDTNTGFFIGPDSSNSNAIQLNIGNANSYIKWTRNGIDLKLERLSVGGTSVNDALSITNHLYYDSSNGFVIYTGDNIITNSTQLNRITVGNIRITSNGMDIYNGSTKLASYGSTTNFYKSGTSNVAASLDSDGLNILSGTITLGSQFSVDSSGTLTAKSAVIGPLTIGTHSSVLCAYTNQRTNYNVDKVGVCMEENGNFGIGCYNSNVNSNTYGWMHFMCDEGNGARVVRGGLESKDWKSVFLGQYNNIIGAFIRDGVADNGTGTNPFVVSWDGHIWIEDGISFNRPEYGKKTGTYIASKSFNHVVFHDYSAKNHWLKWGDWGTTENGVKFVIGNGSNNPTPTMSVWSGNGNIWSAGTVTSSRGTCEGSDERYKTIIEDLSLIHKDLFMNIKPIVFRWNDDEKEKRHFGIGAQTFKKTSEELGYDDLAIINQNDDGRYYANYTELLMLSIPVVQDHEHQIQQLKDEIKQLRSEIKSLKEGG